MSAVYKLASITIAHQCPEPCANVESCSISVSYGPRGLKGCVCREWAIETRSRPPPHPHRKRLRVGALWSLGDVVRCVAKNLLSCLVAQLEVMAPNTFVRRDPPSSQP